MNKEKINPEWYQLYSVHCPNSVCKGMLLQSKYYHANKCSKCGKLWMLVTRYEEVNELV